MLILTRRVGESIVIDGNITVTITNLDMKTGQIKIGVDAPNHIEVNREEIQQRIDRERAQQPYSL